MVDHLNDSNVYKDLIVAEGGVYVENGFTIGPGGSGVGDGVAFWASQPRVQVADVTARDALVAWRAANDPITPTNPLLVWRANGSLTGVNEITTNGTDWYAESPLSGDIEMTMAAAPPYGWMFLQGQTLVNADINYPALWAAASSAFRAGSSLVLPDLRGRVPIGAGRGAGLSLRNLGTQTGAEAVVLSPGQAPAHQHTGTTNNNVVSAVVSHYDADSNPGTSANLDRASTASGGMRPIEGSSHGHTFTTSVAGNNEPHPNMQPSLALNFKVKI